MNIPDTLKQGNYSKIVGNEILILEENPRSLDKIKERYTIPEHLELAIEDLIAKRISERLKTVKRLLEINDRF